MIVFTSLMWAASTTGFVIGLVPYLPLVVLQEMSR